MRAAAVVCASALLTAAACSKPPGRAGEPIRLVDVYRPPQAASASVPAKAPAGTEWRFVPRPAPTGVLPAQAEPLFVAGPGVSGLKVEGGRLVGRTTTAIPIVDLRGPRSEDRDALHEIQVRMRVSAGTNLSVMLRPAEEVDLALEVETLSINPWRFASPIVAGPEMRTYVLRTAGVTPMAARHLLIRPTDVPGATFEIESVRAVSRREHLAGIHDGIGWQGLGDVYREALVAHAPASMPFEVTLPARPRMHLAVGTLEPGPVTFTVSVRQGTTTEVVAQQTVTTPQRWDSLRVDLDRFAGRSVTLALDLSAERAGAVGLWGTPTIHDAVPAASGRADGPPQGVIFIWADTLRRDHLPFHGYGRPTAPILARLAGEGTVFDDSVAQASWTLASGPSMMTSLYPTSTGVQSFNDSLPSSAHTLAEAFRKQGRATMALTSIPFVGRALNMHQGFEELTESGALERSGPLRLKTAKPAVDRLLPWLEDHRDVPFYVLLHVADPHSPMQPEPPYDTLFASPAGRAEHEKRKQAVRPHIKNATMRQRVMPSRSDLAAAGIDPDPYIAYEKDWYDGSIRAMDTELGRVFERLRQLGLDRRTLVVFTADHGEEFLEHGRTFHQQSPYGELSNVPLFFWWPGRVPAGKRVPEMVQSVDIMPTLLDLAGAPPPKGVEGASLAPFLRGERHPAWPRPAVTEAVGRVAPDLSEHYEAVAIALDGWKLVHHRRRPPERPEFELFDRKADPLDQSSVAARHAEIVERLKKELEAWRKRAEARRLPPDSKAAASMSAEELERLRALGYVQ